MQKRVYIGTYTDGPQHFAPESSPSSRGIQQALYDAEVDEWSGLEEAVEVENPSWLAWYPTRPILYAVSEIPIASYRGGGVNVFHVDPGSGRLERSGRYDTLGLAPCHIAVDPGGRFLVVSNYRGGNFAAFAIRPDGDLDAEPVLFQGAGSGPNRIRQDGPHAHSAWFDPKDGSLLMVDLGLDTIFVRNFDASQRRFVEIPGKSDLKVPPGSGCRHVVFSPDGNVLYVAGELDSTVSVFVRRDRGNFEGPVRTVSTLPDSLHGKVADRAEHCDATRTVINTASAIDIHPSGKSLYVSNRGHGSVAVFSIGGDGDRPELVQCLETGIKIPRFCRLDPDGLRFLVCGQESAVVRTYRVDAASGRLDSSGSSLVVDSPVCLLW